MDSTRGDAQADTTATREGRVCPECERRFGEGARFCPFDGTPLQAAPQPAADPLLGRVVGERYEVEALLGEGGMGRVYRVRHRALQRPFALKVLRRELMRDPLLAERFVREARAVAAVRHPGVVAITDFGALDDGAPYFVMELLEGECLALALRRAPLPLREVTRITVAIARAVEAAHEAGIGHRDLKPENVFLVKPPAGGGPAPVRVVDFGAAKVAGATSLTREGIVFGTPHYMSPEHARGEEVDRRSDVYALGCILFELLTGQLPFDSDQFMVIMSQHLHKEPPRPSTFPGAPAPLGALEEIVLKAMAKAPAARFATMASFADVLLAHTRVEADGSLSVAPRLGAAPSLRVREASPRPAATPTDRASLPTWVATKAATPRRGLLFATTAVGALILAASLVWLVRGGPAARPAAEALAAHEEGAAVDGGAEAVPVAVPEAPSTPETPGAPAAPPAPGASAASPPSGAPSATSPASATSPTNAPSPTSATSPTNAPGPASAPGPSAGAPAPRRPTRTAPLPKTSPRPPAPQPDLGDPWGSR
jgi:serine/threonine-protein kinase